MSANITDEQLIDYLSGKVTNEVANTISLALEEDTDLQQRLGAYREIQSLVVTQSEASPSEQADQRFTAFLEKAIEQEQQPTAKHRKLWSRIAAAAAILLVFSLGWFGGQYNKKPQNELAANRALMMELMQQERSSERIRATTVALRAEKADDELINNLAYLLLNDENTNVQLAALNAMLRFANHPQTRDAMLKTLDNERPMIVKLQVIETLVRLNDERVLPYLKKLKNDENLPQRLRDAAQLGTFKLL